MDSLGASQEPNRSLTVLTDGIQNSELARFCMIAGAMPVFSAFERRGDYALSVKPDSFAGTNVNLLLVEGGILPAPGLPYCTNEELRRWWVEYFAGNGAAKTELTSVRF